MSIDKARMYLSEFGLENRIQEFDVSSATVELAAVALGCEPERIAKTMSFIMGDKVILIVTAGNMKVDNQKYKQKFSTKAKMVPFDQVEELTGHAPGGVCPFGTREGVQIYLDISLKNYDKVFPACGSSNSAIGLSIEELEKCSGYLEWIDVCK